MSDLSKYPPEAVVSFFDEILSRKMWSPAKDLRETPGQRIIYPTTEQAWLFWASVKWLDIYVTVGAGIERRRFPIEECITMLRGVLQEMKKQPADEKLVSFTRKDLLMLSDAAVHLDRFSIARQNDGPKKKGAKKK